MYTFVEISRLCILWQLLWGFVKSRLPASFRGPRPATAQRPTAHGPRRPSRPGGPRPATTRGPEARRPGGPVAQSWFSTVFLHRSASGYGVQNGRRWVWIRLPFNHMNPCFCLLHVVQIKTFSFSLHSSLYRNRWHNRGLLLSNDKLFSNHTLKVKIS